jgi:hypothetical protein
MMEGTLPFANADRTLALAGLVGPRNKNKTRNTKLWKTLSLTQINPKNAAAGNLLLDFQYSTVSHRPRSRFGVA